MKSISPESDLKISQYVALVKKWMYGQKDGLSPIEAAKKIYKPPKLPKSKVNLTR